MAKYQVPPRLTTFAPPAPSASPTMMQNTPLMTTATACLPRSCYSNHHTATASRAGQHESGTGDERECSVHRGEWADVPWEDGPGTPAGCELTGGQANPDELSLYPT